MAITFVAAGTALHVARPATSITPALPAGAVAGDLLLIFAANRSADVQLAAPAGYRVLATSIDGSAWGNHYFHLYGKIHSGAESAPVLVTTPDPIGGGTANDLSAQMAAFRGVQAQALRAAYATSVAASGIPTAACDVPRLPALVLALAWKSGPWTSIAPLSGVTEIGDAPNATILQSIGWDYQIPSTTADIAASSFVVTGDGVAQKRSAIVVLPALSIEADAVDVYPPRVLVTVAGITLGDSVEVYRLVGGVRTLLRGGSDDSVADSSFVRVDAELPFGVPVSYVAIVEGAEYSTTATTYTLPGGKLALSDGLSGLAAEAWVSAWPDKAYTPQASVFKVGGRNVVVSGALGMFEGTIELYTETTSSRDNLWNLLDNCTEGVIQIRQPGGYDGVDCYVTVLSATESRKSQDGSDQRRLHTLQVAEVEAWADALEAHGFTLQDIADAYDGFTLQDLYDDYPTLLTLAQGEFGV